MGVLGKRKRMLECLNKWRCKWKQMSGVAKRGWGKEGLFEGRGRAGNNKKMLGCLETEKRRC